MCAPLPRAQAKGLPKTIAKVGLGGEAALGGDAGQGIASCQQLLGPLESEPLQVTMGWAAQALAEHAGKMVFAQARLPGKIAQSHGVRQVGQQVLLHPPDNDGARPPRTSGRLGASRVW